MTEINITEISQFTPTTELTNFNTGSCYDWCLEQTVVHSNNLELQMMLFPAVSFVFLLLYFEADNFEILKDYQNFFIYMAKLFLIIFFAVYLLIVRMRLIY